MANCSAKPAVRPTCCAVFKRRHTLRRTGLELQFRAPSSVAPAATAASAVASSSVFFSFTSEETLGDPELIRGGFESVTGRKLNEIAGGRNNRESSAALPVTSR